MNKKVIQKKKMKSEKNKLKSQKVEILKTLKYVWQFMKQHKKYFFAANLLTMISVLLGFFLVPIYLKEFIDLMVNFDGDLREILKPEIYKIIFTVLGINILAFWSISRIAEYFLCIFAMNLMKGAEKIVFKEMLNHSTSFFSNNFSGSLASSFGRFVRALDGFNTLIYFNVSTNLVRFISSIMIVSFYVPFLGVALFFWIIVFISTVFFLVKKYRMPLSIEVAKLESEISGKNSDVYSNINSVKMFAQEKFERKYFDVTVEKLFKARSQSWFMWLKVNMVQSILVTLLEVFALYFMAKMWINGNITIGTIVLIQGFLLQIYINLWNVGNVIQDFFRYLADSNDMIEILEKKLDIQDPQKPEKVKISKGEIEFKNLSFDYIKSDTQKLFKNFNLKINSGERIGLVGESGAGKSTFVNLLLRFMDPESGKVLIDGQDISKITQNNLRKNIAYVSQDPLLFHRSLRENISYGNQNATEKEFLQAVKNANAEGFIKNFPEKFETLVGERGVKLSGGQKQRITIARAMLKRSPILILDEATSALDSKAEVFIQEALEKLMKNRTTIVIAHRLSTLRKMDKILVLHEGQIVESGSHEHLLKQKGKYSELWEHQSGGFLG